jgi:hypothetical protein
VFTRWHVAYGVFALDLDGESDFTVRISGCSSVQEGIDCINELFALRAAAPPGSPAHPSWDQLACAHEWDFAPGCRSTIDCPHK